MNEFDKQNHELWKWGVIYYNPNDSAIWVEKRNGCGWTVNFAHTISWLIIVMILAIPLALFLFSMLQ